MQETDSEATLKSEFGKYISVQVQPGDTFSDLKARIEESCGYSLSVKNIRCKGNPIEDNQNILNYISKEYEGENAQKGSYHDLCRLCAKNTHKMLNVFSQGLDYINMIRSCLSIHVTFDDTLPKIICLSCIKILRDFQEFKHTTVEAETKLKNMCSLLNNEISLNENKPETSTLLDSRELFSSTAEPPDTTSCDFGDDDHVTPCVDETLENVNECVSNIYDETQIDDNSNDGNPFRMPCKWCSKSFVTVMELYNHSLTHSGYLNPQGIKNNSTKDKSIRRRSIPKKQTCYICMICDQVYPVKTLLLHHCKLTHRTIEKNVITGGIMQLSRVFACSSCDATYVRLRQLFLHHQKCSQFNDNIPQNGEQDVRMKLWHVPLIKTIHHNCEYCGVTFPTMRRLSQHKLGADYPPDMEKQFTCVECHRTYVSNCALKSHMKSHTCTKDYICELCGRTFAKMSALISHRVKHSSDRPFPCQDCSKSFKTKEQLRTHSRVHSGERPYGCRVCSRTFKTSSVLSKHMKTHNDSRPFTCSICPSAFKTSYARRVHVLIHTGQKPYKCHFCSVSFRYRKDMTKHIQNIHGIVPGNDT